MYVTLVASQGKLLVTAEGDLVFDLSTNNFPLFLKRIGPMC